MDESQLMSFLESLQSRFCGLKMNQNQKNDVYQLCLDLVQHVNKFNHYLITSNNQLNPLQCLELSTLVVENKLSECATSYKRQKKLQSNDLYVAPKEISLGVRWNVLRENIATAMIPRLIPCKAQVVSITDTVISLFKREDFRSVYFEYNRPTENDSTTVYANFRSGSVFESNELFSKYPNSVQIQVTTDDFEMGNGLGSKATLHKLTPIYFALKNIPDEFASQLNTVHVAALCHADDLKTKYTDFNDIWLHIVKDIKLLEKGVDIGDGTIIHGTLCNFGSDNLGSHQAQGFVANFSTTHYPCRFCLCTKDECSTLCRDVPEKKRTRQHHQEQVAMIENATKVDPKVTKGVVRDCTLNDLRYFNIIDNMVPDIMHDLDEGTIPMLLLNLFKYFISKKLYSEQEIVSKVQYFDFGFTNKKNIPSIIKLQKDNLNQNASQLLCLFRHIPYIFYEKRNEQQLKSVWDCVCSLLRVVQIAYSLKIDSQDLVNLENYVENHLRLFQSIFKIKLRTKQHNITHYARIIRAMGPLKPMSMKIYERKHQDLKRRVTGKNFMNLSKSIMVSHQEHIFTVCNVYVDEINMTKKQNINDFVKNELEKNLGEDENLDDFFEVKSLEFNGIKFREFLFVNSQKYMYEINKILINKSNVYFLCSRFNFHSFNDFLNSIKIVRAEPFVSDFIKLETLTNKNSYEKKEISGETFIILETLDLSLSQNMFE